MTKCSNVFFYGDARAWKWATCSVTLWRLALSLSFNRKGLWYTYFLCSVMGMPVTTVMISWWPVVTIVIMIRKMMVSVVRCRLFDGQPAGGGVNHGLMVIERLKVIMLKNWCWGWHSLRIQPSLLDAVLGAFRLAKRPEKSEERRMFSKARNNSVGKILWVLFPLIL